MALSSLTPQQTAALTSLATNLEFYSRHCLRIVGKDGTVRPLIFNRAQKYIHERLENQKKTTGMVRAVLLKGRQLGCTTYVQARYFHRTQFQGNLSAFVLAHQADSTLKIFGMAQRFRQHLPNVDLRQELLKDTERSMTMENFSSYSVGTAGSAQVGRGMTVHLFHGSECAFYENAEELSTGLLQTVADVAGTEMIFESTANGPGNFFYNLVMGAIAGTNGFMLIFIPWYWDETYQDPVPLAERELDEKERKYYEAYKSDGLTLRHLAWRRRKIAAFENQEWRFIQEYPFNPEEAFVKAEGRFFDLARFYMARGKRIEEQTNSAFIIGVDQGRTGDDTEIGRRNGRKIFPFQTIPADDGVERDMRLAGIIAKIIESEKPDMVFIDVTNEHGTLDRLHELGYKRVVRGIHFGEGALDPQRHRNKRTEMYANFREWSEEPDCSIPDDQKFFAEVGAMPRERETSNNVMYLEPKEKIKQVLGWSPNKLDAIVLTFAYPVRRKSVSVGPLSIQSATPIISTKFRSSLSTRRGVN